MREDWSDQPKALRHLMNAVLFFQLDALRDALDYGNIAQDQAARAMLTDRCLGYFFGLAANYADACGLPQQSVEARAVIYDVHTWTFGADHGRRIVQEQTSRHTLAPTFEIGIEQAHKDVNSFKRALKREEEVPNKGLVEQVHAAISTNVSD
jgi:hypothetical protein